MGQSDMFNYSISVWNSKQTQDPKQYHTQSSICSLIELETPKTNSVTMNHSTKKAHLNDKLF